MLVMLLFLNGRALVIWQGAYFPYADGVLFLSKWYICEWCWYCCDREYRQVLQYLFQCRKIHAQKVTEIVQKNFIGIDIGRFAEFLYISPNVCTVKWLACSVMKIQPNLIFFSAAYFRSLRWRAFTIKALLRLSLQKTTASPFLTASTVMNCNSLTRIPVPQIVCKIMFRLFSSNLKWCWKFCMICSVIKNCSTKLTPIKNRLVLLFPNKKQFVY